MKGHQIQSYYKKLCYLQEVSYTIFTHKLIKVSYTIFTHKRIKVSQANFAHKLLCHSSTTAYSDCSTKRWLIGRLIRYLSQIKAFERFREGILSSTAQDEFMSNPKLQICFVHKSLRVLNRYHLTRASSSEASSSLVAV